jgi:glycerol-3-phosphate acyltransferase PlsX
MLEAMDWIAFRGFIEGTDVTQEAPDVIVTDGFSGNIALKTIEGTMKYLAHVVRTEISKSILGKIGCLLLNRSISSIRNVIDPGKHNGAPLVGLQKVVVKSHGGSDHLSLANAISAAIQLARLNFTENVTNAIKSIRTDREE